MRVKVVAAVILNFEKKILLVRRGKDQSGAGEWEFAGGKVETGESEEQALYREIKEELNIQIQITGKIGNHSYTYPNREIDLHVFIANYVRGDIALSDHDAHKWVDRDEIETHALSEADRYFVPLIKSKLI